MPVPLIPPPSDWQYIQWHPSHSGIDLEPVGDNEGHHELVVNRDHKKEWCQPVFHNFPHLTQWRTNDLFQRHPHKPDLWLFRGRKDDTIVLSNAEKFNPVSMESIIQGHAAVKGALVVGKGRFQCALIIEPNEGESLADDLMIESIWPTVEIANSLSPGYAQIDKQLIMVSKPHKPFQRAGKVNWIIGHSQNILTVHMNF